MYSIVKKLIVKSQATATQAAQSSVKKLEHRFFDVSKAATTSASSMSPGPAVPRSTNANPGVLDGRKYPLRPFLPFTSNLVEPSRNIGNRSHPFHTSSSMCANLTYDLHGLIVKDVPPTTYYGCPVLPKDPPETFALALDWLHTKKFAAPRNNEDPTLWIWDPVEMFARGKMLDNQELMDAIMNAWIESDAVHNCLPGVDIIDAIYTKFPTGSAPRKYVSWAMFWGTRDNPKDGRFVDEAMKELMKKHPDLKEDFNKYLEVEMDFIAVEDPRKVSPEEFHQGAEGADDDDKA